jgi:hypothetical protein
MSKVDTLNFRGKYRQYDVDGKPYLYFIGDTVEHNAKIYVSVRPTSSKVPGTQEGGVFWKETGGNFGFYIQETAPRTADIGDRWYIPSTAIMYTYVKEGNHAFWVEL